jgi:hypothetical protein
VGGFEKIVVKVKLKWKNKKDVMEDIREGRKRSIVRLKSSSC